MNETTITNVCDPRGATGGGGTVDAGVIPQLTTAFATLLDVVRRIQSKTAPCGKTESGAN